MKTLPKDLSPVVQELQNQINSDTTFTKLLNYSLANAQQAAQLNLSSDLYKALNDLYTTSEGISCGWPTVAEDYISYLTAFEQVLPSESIPYSPWSNPEGYSQEVYDRLCQFYWLINQPLPDYNDKTMQSYTNAVSGFSFADWLDQYAIEWGNFLNTPDSLTTLTLASFIADPMYNTIDYLNDKPNWNSFNTFFYRQLNANKADGSPIIGPSSGGLLSIGLQCKNLPTDGYIEFSVPGPDTANTISFPKTKILSPNYCPSFLVEYPAVKGGFVTKMNWTYYQGSTPAPTGSCIVPLISAEETSPTFINKVAQIAPHLLTDAHHYGSPTDFLKDNQNIANAEIKKMMIIGSMFFQMTR